jgi:hypothetical protein
VKPLSFNASPTKDSSRAHWENTMDLVCGDFARISINLCIIHVTLLPNSPLDSQHSLTNNPATPAVSRRINALDVLCFKIFTT